MVLSDIPSAGDEIMEAHAETVSIPKTIPPSAREQGKRERGGIRRASSRLSFRFRSRNTPTPAEALANAEARFPMSFCRVREEKPSVSSSQRASGSKPSSRAAKKVSFAKLIQTFDEKYVSSRRNSLKVFLKSALKGGTQKESRAQSTLEKIPEHNLLKTISKSPSSPTLSDFDMKKIATIKESPSGIKSYIPGAGNIFLQQNSDTESGPHKETEQDQDLSVDAIITIQPPRNSARKNIARNVNRLEREFFPNASEVDGSSDLSEIPPETVRVIPGKANAINTIKPLSQNSLDRPVRNSKRPSAKPSSKGHLLTPTKIPIVPKHAGLFAHQGIRPFRKRTAGNQTLRFSNPNVSAFSGELSVGENSSGPRSGPGTSST